MAYFHFLSLPLEVRFTIYSFLLLDAYWIHPALNLKGVSVFDPRYPTILAVCRQIRHEVYKTFFKQIVLVMDVVCGGQRTGILDSPVRQVARAMGRDAFGLITRGRALTIFALW